MLCSSNWNESVWGLKWDECDAECFLRLMFVWVKITDTDYCSKVLTWTFSQRCMCLMHRCSRLGGDVTQAASESAARASWTDGYDGLKPFMIITTRLRCHQSVLFARSARAKCSVWWMETGLSWWSCWEYYVVSVANQTVRTNRHGLWGWDTAQIYAFISPEQGVKQQRAYVVL